MTDQIELPKLPDNWAPYVPLVTTLLRQALTTAGAAGFTWAMAVTASQVEMAVSAALIAASSLWGLWQKRRARLALGTAAANPAFTAPPNVPA